MDVRKCFPNGFMSNTNEHSWNGCKVILSNLDRVIETHNYNIIKSNLHLIYSHINLWAPSLMMFSSLVELSISIRIFPFESNSHEIAHKKDIKPKSSGQAKVKQMTNTFKKEGIRGKESSFMFSLNPAIPLQGT